MMHTSQVLHHLYSLDTSSPDFLRYLHCLIRSDEKDQYLTSLQGLELTRLVDFLDGTLGVAPVTDDVFRRCIRKLRTICSQHAILPSSYTISGALVRLGDEPVDFGGFSVVWEGTYNGSKVCIKHLKVSEQNRGAVQKAFYKEAIIWKRLRHPNVVAFIGVKQNSLQFVSEWMPNGTLTEYINKKPGANRLLDVAEGLNYLHANHTSHGDLKGPNILVDDDGHACLTDFGFASIVRGLSSIFVSKVEGYTARWAAPEVLWSGGKITREADLFAFGMVAVEVFTGDYPFGRKLPDGIATTKVMDGERPERPQDPGLTDSLWNMTRDCWQQDPAHRPAITKVVGILRECYMQCAVDTDLFGSNPPRPVKAVTVKAKNIDSTTMPLGFSSAYRRINKIAVLGNRKDGPKGKRYSELLQLCARWNAVPASYELGGVLKRGDRPERVSWMTEIWKGRYHVSCRTIPTTGRLIGRCADGVDDHLRLLPSVSLVQKRQHHTISGEKSTYKSMRPDIGCGQRTALSALQRGRPRCFVAKPHIN
ncbi:kinase-like domain-containing protein [Thelephora terrestris]|uniref:Kinase-like domain-containing protein n=1 Tax=Thelephora terrestris TaxID=56493 RepID=A0A9P6H5D2_9AGAM|nr:kinase-like domain-containing protein [Thelephora terrestris]